MLVFFMCLVKSLKNLINDKEMWLFSDFQYGFKSSQSTADLLTIVSDRTARAFNRSRATRAVPLDISGLLTGFGILVFFTNLSLMEFQVRYLVLCDQASDLWQQLELALNLNLIYETL